jgi:nucleoside diphosphate kinase
MIAHASAVRRRLSLAAVAIVLMLTAGAGYEIRSTRPSYLESALVVFSLPKSQSAPYAYTMLASSLITSGDVVTQVLMGPQAQRQIREAGGAAEVSLKLVNLYSEQYPDYGQPLADLTAMSPSAAKAHLSFEIAVRLVRRLLAARQAHEGARPRNRVSAQIIGDTGPVVQEGSSKRVYAGLAALALIAVSVVRGFLCQRE